MMAKKSSDNLSKKVEALSRDNARLQAENSLLRTKVGNQGHAFGKGWRMFAIVLSVALATTFLIVGNILFWAGGTLINTDKYSDTMSSVIKDPEVQKGVALYTTNKIFDNVDVAGTIQNALPPRAGFLASPLTSQVEKATNGVLLHVVSSDKFQATFVKLNTNAHDKFISAIKNSKSDGTINIQDVYNQLSESLQNTKLSFLAGKTLPTKVGSIQVVDAPWLPKARSIIDGIGWIKPVTLLLVALFSTLAIWLSKNRRKLVIILGSFFTISMLISLVSFRVVRSIIVSHAATQYQTAVDHAASIILHPLAVQTITLLLIGLLITVVAWISGPYKAAQNVRGRLDTLLSGKLHQAVFSKENAFTLGVAQHKRMLQWLSVALVAIIMLLVTLSPGLVVKYGILIVVLVLIIETLAAPHSRRSR
jgi:hypothetical protein